MKNLQLKIIDSILTLSWIGLLLSIAIMSLSFVNHFQIEKPELDNQIDYGPFSTLTIAHYSDDQEEAFLLGKNLFKTNCATCHNRNMVDDMTGPALDGFEKRWAGFPKEDLYQWIRNSQKLIEDKHPYALKLWNRWRQSTMSSFENLTNEEIEAIFFYIKEKNR